MSSYSVLFINKKLCRAKTFSGILTNLPKKLAAIKLINLNKSYKNFKNLEPIFPKRIFLVQNKRNEHNDQIP